MSNINLNKFFNIVYFVVIFLFFEFIASQDIYYSSIIEDKGIGKNKSYIISTTVRLGKSSSIEMAEKKAFNYSAETVLRRRGGFEIKSSTILQEQDNGKFFNQMISVELDGEVTDYKVLEKKMYIDNDDFFIAYTFEFWINGESKKDPYFTISAEADKYELIAGENFSVSFTSNQNCYMYMYNFLPYENKVVSLLNEEVKKNELWKKSFGTEFGEECSNGIQSFEHIIFLAIKKEKNILFGKEYVTYEEFQKQLKKLPRKDYESEMVSYIINRN